MPERDPKPQAPGAEPDLEVLLDVLKDIPPDMDGIYPTLSDAKEILKEKAAAHAGGPPPPSGAQAPNVNAFEVDMEGPPGHILRYFVENDDLCDDWPCFPTQKEAEDFVLLKCQETADANIDERGIGNCPLYQGMPRAEIVKALYEEHVGCIDPRWIKSTGLDKAPEVLEAIILSDDFHLQDPDPDVEQFTSLQEKFQLAVKAHAEAVARAIEEGIRGIRGLEVRGHLDLVEWPDEAEGYRFRFEGLTATFPEREFLQSVLGEHTWDVSVTCSHDLDTISIQAWNAAESIPKDLEEWDGSYKPFEVGKDATEFMESLPRLRDKELRHRQLNGF